MGSCFESIFFPTGRHLKKKNYSAQRHASHGNDPKQRRWSKVWTLHKWRDCSLPGCYRDGSLLQKDAPASRWGHHHCHPFQTALQAQPQPTLGRPKALLSAESKAATNETNSFDTVDIFPKYEALILIVNIRAATFWCKALKNTCESCKHSNEEFGFLDL